MAPEFGNNGDHRKKESQKDVLKKALQQPSPNLYWIQGVSLVELLRSEKYRMEIAIKYSDTDIEAYTLLGMPERTFYAKKKKYGLKRD